MLYRCICVSVYLSFRPQLENAPSRMDFRDTWIQLSSGGGQYGCSGIWGQRSSKVIWGNCSNMLKTLLRQQNSIEFDEIWVKWSFAKVLSKLFEAGIFDRRWFSWCNYFNLVKYIYDWWMYSHACWTYFCKVVHGTMNTLYNYHNTDLKWIWWRTNKKYDVFVFIDSQDWQQLKCILDLICVVSTNPKFQIGLQTGPCVLIRWPRYIYFPMDECTQPIRSILIIRPRFGAIHLYTEKQDKTQKVWLMFLCPKNILHRFNLPSWHFWKTIIIGNQISSFVEKHATHLKRFSFQIV